MSTREQLSRLVILYWFLLQLTSAQLEALRLEHQNLQEMRALDVSSTSRDLHQAEIQLQELQQLHTQHVQSSKTLEVSPGTGEYAMCASVENARIDVYASFYSNICSDYSNCTHSMCNHLKR